MEEKQEIEQAVEEEKQTKEEKGNKESESTEKLANEIKEKIIPMIEDNPILPHKDTSVNHENMNLQQPPLQTIRVEEEKRKVSSRKPNLKSKFSVPKPFSFATEKRMQSRERRSDSGNFSTSTQKITSSEKLGSGSVNFKDSQPKLSKSVGLNDRTRVEATKPRHVIFPATKTSCKVKVTTTEPASDNKIEKQQGKEVDKVNLGRSSSTFKAPPLPKIPPSKKMQATTRPKSPVIMRRSKSVSDGEKRSSVSRTQRLGNHTQNASN